MLKPDFYNFDEIESVFSELHTDLLCDMSSNIVRELNNEPESDLEAAVNVTTAVKKVYREAVAESVKNDNENYKEASLPIIKTTDYAGAVKQGITEQLKSFERLTGRATESARELYNRTLNKAYSAVKSGSTSYTQALADVIRTMTAEGVTVYNTPSGRNIPIEAHALMSIRTRVNKLCGEITMQGAQEHNITHFETSAHVNSRESHRVWQGRVWTKQELYSVCGYEEPGGLLGCNCRHSFSPYIIGVSTPRWTPEQLREYDKTMVGKYTAYEASQEQRRLERQIRKWKRRIATLKAIDADTTREREKLKYWNKQHNIFIEETGLKPQQFRLMV